jgi:uncharacterized delta-60 repeat protein
MNRIRFELLEGRQLMSAGLDPTFGVGGKISSDVLPFEPRGVAVQADGKMIAVGELHNNFVVARVNADGTPDAAFGDGGGITTTDFGGNKADFANAVAIRPDGKIVVVGRFGNDAGTVFSTDSEFAVAQYNPDGTLDKSFSKDGKTTIGFSGHDGDQAKALAIQPDGKVILVGSANSENIFNHDSDFAVARLNRDGSPDMSFGVFGKFKFKFQFQDLKEELTAVHVASDGKFVVAGQDSRSWFFARFNANGGTDSTFGSSGMRTVDVAAAKLNAVTVISGNRVVAVGTSRTDFAVVRLDAKGKNDRTFGGGSGKVTTDLFDGSKDEAFAVSGVSRGKILVSGVSGGNSAMVLYNADGSLDTTFGSGGKFATDLGGRDSIRETRVLPDGKILALARNGQGQVFTARFLNPFSPKVEIFALKTTASEDAGNASFIVTRDAVYDFTTRVFFDLSGTATLGQDYSGTFKIVDSTNTGALARAVTPGKRVFVDIPAGQSSVEARIKVTDDKTVENNETVTLAVFDNPLYTTGAHKTSTITILDNDSLNARTRRLNSELFSMTKISDVLPA